MSFGNWARKLLVSSRTSTLKSEPIASDRPTGLDARPSDASPYQACDSKATVGLITSPSVQTDRAPPGLPCQSIWLQCMFNGREGLLPVVAWAEEQTGTARVRAYPDDMFGPALLLELAFRVMPRCRPTAPPLQKHEWPTSTRQVNGNDIDWRAVGAVPCKLAPWPSRASTKALCTPDIAPGDC